MAKSGTTLLVKAIIAVIVILLPVLVIFVVEYNKNKEHLKETVLEDLTVIAEAYEAQVFQFIEAAKVRAVDFSSDGLLQSELKKIKSGASSTTLSTHLKKNKLAIDKNIVAIQVVGNTGTIVASTTAGAVGTDISGENFFLAEGRPPLVVERATPLDGKYVIAISAPIIDRVTKKRRGFIVNYISITELNKLFSGEFNKERGALSWNRGKRKTMEIYLVGRTKLMLTESRFVADAVMSLKVDTLPVRACLNNGSELSAYYKDYRDKDIVGASMCIPTLGWTLIAEIDADEALSQVAKMRTDALIAGLIVGGLIILLFVFYYNTVIVRLRRISKATEEIGQGNFKIDLPVKTTDEIGLLSNSLNIMASEIGRRSIDLRKSEESLAEAQR
ncbi:MAG: HAMP domain-containing protein, partial [Thermodesulfobacteriota bacterium]